MKKKSLNGERAHCHIDLGLAILAATSKPPHSYVTMAAYCNCSPQRWNQIGAKALRKVRAALYRDPELCNALRLR